MPTRYIGDGYWEIVSRKMSIVTRSEQQRFKDAKIAVIGCGGIGGETIEMLVRMGVGSLTVVDEDAFDMSNLNRQTLASMADLGIEKSAVAKEKVRLINPYVDITSYSEHVDETNIDKIIGDADIAQLCHSRRLCYGIFLEGNAVLGNIPLKSDIVKGQHGYIFAYFRYKRLNFGYLMSVS